MLQCAVVVGFVNALAILILWLNYLNFVSVTWHVYVLTIIGLGIIYLYPYVPKIAQIITLSSCYNCFTYNFVYFVGWDVRNVGDMGELPDTLPIILDVPMNFETLSIIFPYSFALAIVGL